MAASDDSQFPSPKSLLFSISAGIGGHGLNVDALEALKGAWGRGYLGEAVAFSNRQNVIPGDRIRTLWWHPARLLKFLPKAEYGGARKHALDAVAARRLRQGGHDIFHSWSGDCLQSLRVANELGIASVVEIPTWHRDKGKTKPRVTKRELREAEIGGLAGLRHRLTVTRAHTLEEYDRADLLLVLSEKAKETFLTAGFAEDKVFMLPRGVDVGRFRPADAPPPSFRAVFVGSVIRRKGAHHLLEAWNRLRLPGAELTLVGWMEPEVREVFERLRPPNVRHMGFAEDVSKFFREASVHVFPSECEGSAKVTYEAAASGLPQITTLEAGDVVVPGKTGWVIPPNDVDALCAALEDASRRPADLWEMGRAARARMENEFTWDHYRERLDRAYRTAMARRSAR
ncbi:MAG: glycosyltransferase family 4 protein [Verrucomicrobiales bacterium]